MATIKAFFDTPKNLSFISLIMFCMSFVNLWPIKIDFIKFEVTSDTVLQVESTITLLSLSTITPIKKVSNVLYIGSFLLSFAIPVIYTVFLE